MNLFFANFKELFGEDNSFFRVELGSSFSMMGTFFEHGKFEIEFSLNVIRESFLKFLAKVLAKYINEI